MSVGLLIDIDKDLRLAEGALRCGFRYLNNTKDEAWFDLMEELGFLVDGAFIPIGDIIDRSFKLNVGRAFALESVSCGLSSIANKYYSS